MTKHLSAREAIELLDIPASTFYRLVKEGKITKYYPTAVSKHGTYSPNEIAHLKGQFKEEESDIDELGATDWLKSTDVGNIYDLEYPIFGDQTSNPSLVRKWHERNPHIYRLLFNKDDRRDLWGVMNMLPLEDEVIFRLLRGEIQVADLDPQKDILTFDQPGTYHLYVPSVVLRSQKWQHFVVLLNSVFDYWCSQSPERMMGKVYAHVRNKPGELLAKKLFFSPLWHISDTAYVLDVARPNPSRIIQGFQQCLEQKREHGN